MDAWEKFKSYVNEKKLVEPGDRVMIAVSGGPDSVCLAHMFWRLRKSMPLELVIVNIDHGLRAESSREATKVEKLGTKLDIPVIVSKLKVREAAASEKISIETAGRNLRYGEFLSLAKEKRFNKIATGHTANDNAETILMWLIRGTGNEGLSGIPARRNAGGKVAIIRPMLPITRGEVMAYVRRQRLGYSTDSSNLTLDFTRNRIRHKVIPLLNAFNPRFIEHASNLSEIVSLDNDFLGKITARAVKRAVRSSKSGFSLDLKRFFGYNEAVQRRILKEILPEKRSLQNVRCLKDFILSLNRKEILLSKHWRIEKRRNRLYFRRTAGLP